eukprot:UN21377
MFPINLAEILMPNDLMSYLSRLLNPSRLSLSMVGYVVLCPCKYS